LFRRLPDHSAELKARRPPFRRLAHSPFRFFAVHWPLPVSAATVSGIPPETLKAADLIFHSPQTRAIERN
jgi:hypothetical protein